jgi:acetoin:2,6-dichlorophenolindophenol oxidoreductase subunit alpha
MVTVHPPEVASPAEDAAVQAEYQSVDIEQWLRIYEQMLKIRHFEETVNELYKGARMPGLAHLYCGEEAVAVGVCETLGKQDYITSTHRGHGHCLAKGARVDLMFAELLGKAAGYCKGKGGSMHIADPETGNLGANAIVGGGAGIATGAAFSGKMRKSGQVAVCFFGDGALGQGVLYEVMNMAALWKLPILYVCENNLYTEYTYYKEVLSGNIRSRPQAFGIPVEEVDGQDARQVYTTALRLVEKIRQGEGPAFLICNTYRYYGHHVGDINRGYYRPKEEEELWKETHDPIQLLAGWLVNGRAIQPSILESIEDSVRKEIEASVKFAEAAPFPDPSEVDKDVYVD